MIKEQKIVLPFVHVVILKSDKKENVLYIIQCFRNYVKNQFKFNNRRILDRRKILQWL